MADIKVSQLPTATELSGSSVLMVISDAGNKKITFANLLKSVKTDLIVNSAQAAASLKVYSDSSNNLLVSDPVLGRIGVGTNTPGALLHANGNFKVGDTDVAGVVINSHETLVADGTSSKISNPGIGITRVTFSGSTTMILTLSNGIPYQSKTFVVAAPPVGGVCNITIQPMPWVGATTPPTIKLTKVGDSITLLYDETGWCIQSYTGATIN